MDNNNVEVLKTFLTDYEVLEALEGWALLTNKFGECPDIDKQLLETLKYRLFMAESSVLKDTLAETEPTG